MKSRRMVLTGVTASLGMLFLILDTEAALSGAREGITLCLKTVVPSLYPFFILSVLLTGALTGANIPFMAALGRVCRIPKGAESLLLTGLLGGYPVGAQCIGQAYAAGQLNRGDARRMLGFCNNAGPAFIFGMIGSLFSAPAVPFVIWGIHIVSALLIGILLPGGSYSEATVPSPKPVGLPAAINRSIRIMAGVCGWVILFRVILAFLQRWFLWLLPSAGQILICGLLELSNGCAALGNLENEALRFLYACIFLGFGGICVGMQTVSVTGQSGLDTGDFFLGKFLHACISALLALLAGSLLFPTGGSGKLNLFLLIAPFTAAAVLFLLFKKRKKSSSLLQKNGV